MSTLLSFSPVYACIAGISNDIGKLRPTLQRNEDGIWVEVTENQPWLPLLRNPNHYQDRIKFFEQWMLSKLMYGNTYVLKERDARGVVNRMFILHPSCIKPLVSPDGSVFYSLQRDDLSGLTEDVLEDLKNRYGEIAIPAPYSRRGDDRRFTRAWQRPPNGRPAEPLSVPCWPSD